MAEILIRVVEHRHSTPATAHLHIGAYEVVVIRDNGWPWSRKELNNPDWRVIRIPNTTMDALTNWTDSQLMEDGALVFKRVNRIDHQISQVQSIIDSWRTGVVNDISTGDRNKLINAVVDKRGT